MNHWLNRQELSERFPVGCQIKLPAVPSVAPESISTVTGYVPSLDHMLLELDHVRVIDSVYALAVGEKLTEATN